MCGLPQGLLVRSTFRSFFMQATCQKHHCMRASLHVHMPHSNSPATASWSAISTGTALHGVQVEHGRHNNADVLTLSVIV